MKNISEATEKYLYDFARVLFFYSRFFGYGIWTCFKYPMEELSRGKSRMWWYITWFKCMFMAWTCRMVSKQESFVLNRVCHNPIGVPSSSVETIQSHVDLVLVIESAQSSSGLVRWSWWGSKIFFTWVSHSSQLLSGGIACWGHQIILCSRRRGWLLDEPNTVISMWRLVTSVISDNVVAHRYIRQRLRFLRSGVVRCFDLTNCSISGTSYFRWMDRDGMPIFSMEISYWCINFHVCCIRPYVL